MSRFGKGPANPSDRVYIAVAPPKTLGEEFVKRAASLIGKEAYDTRLLLVGENPRIIVSCPDAFVRIFDRESSVARVEMFQNHTDYGFLGAALTPSAPENFMIAVMKLREWFSSAIFDERPTRGSPADIPTAGPAEALEINCRLIYLGHRAAGSPGS